MAGLSVALRSVSLAAFVTVAGSAWMVVPAAAATPPTVPTAVAVAQPVQGKATISWSPPTSAGSSPISGYGVSRDGTDSAGNGPYSTTVAATARSFTMTKLITGDTYSLSVWAISAAGAGPAASVSVTILPAPAEAVVIQTGASSAAIQWQPPTGVSGITGYRVARNGTDSSGAGPYSKIVASTTTSFTMTKLVSGSRYTLSVQVVTASSVGPPASQGVTIFPAWTTSTMSDPSGSTGSVRNGLACRSRTWCIAVGSWDNSSSVELPLAQRWNGSTWSTLPMTLPAGATAGELTAISCPSTTLCMAVGDYKKITTSAFAARWNGSKWTLATLPIQTGNSAIPAGVSCPTTSSCMAVGYTWNTKVTVPYAVRWNGTSWSSTAPKNPATSTGYTELKAVSCPSTARCEAVGTTDYDDQAQETNNLIEGWNGTTWTVQESGGDPGNLYLSTLTSISCPTTTACTTVGYSYDPDDDYYGADEYRWNGTSWTYITTPDPTGGVEDLNDPVLSAVSCVSATACTALGWESEYGNTYAVNQSAGAFSLQTLPGSGTPTAISCFTATTCIAVGSNQGGSHISSIRG